VVFNRNVQAEKKKKIGPAWLGQVKKKQKDQECCEVGKTIQTTRSKVRGEKVQKGQSNV